MWLTDYQYNAILLIAEEDIKAIMFLAVKDNGEIYYPYKNVRYHLNKKNKCKKLRIKKYAIQHFWQVKGGYDSFEECLISLDRIYTNGSFGLAYTLDYGGCIRTLDFDTGMIPFECIIPKGTQYYINDSIGCIVSETIIVKKPHAFTFQPDLIGTESADKLMELVDRINKFVEDESNK